MANSKRFYVKNVGAWKSMLMKKNFSDKELEIKVVEHGIVLPARYQPDGTWKGGVCDSDFNFIAGFSRRDSSETIRGGAACVESSYTVDRKELINLDEDVIFGGSLNGHFGHFIAECLCRLWYVLQRPESKTKILFITTDFGGRKPWFDDFFRLMGIDKERIVYVDKPFQCRSVTVPEQSQYNPWGHIKYTKEFFLPYQAIKSGVKPSNHKKIYLTRTQLDLSKNPRVCFNEKYFEDFFSARGFEVIAPEKLTLEEQLALIMGADEIAATLGTLTHWAIFCKPSVKFIMLNRAHTGSYAFQIFLNEAFNIDNYYIVDVYKSFLYVANHTNGVFLLGSTKYWTNFVADYFGEQIDEDDDMPYMEEALDKYVNFWCRKYQDPKHFDIWVETLNKLCRRIIELERETSKNRPSLIYQTHIANKGWSNWTREGTVSNPLEQKLDIQAIKLDFSKPFHAVHYATYDEKDGWSNEVESPEMAGTTGQRKSITGIKIRLDEAGAEEFDILYRVHKFDGAWTPWAQNGEELLSGGAQLNAIQIKLKPKLKV